MTTVQIYRNRNFNPRLREGGDRNTGSGLTFPMISIHASGKEATVVESKREDIVVISIHASGKEATLTVAESPSSFSISIHASGKEATATYCDTSAIMYISSLNNFFVHYF